MKNVFRISIDRKIFPLTILRRAFPVDVIQLERMEYAIQLVVNVNAEKDLQGQHVPSVHWDLRGNFVQNVHVMFAERWKVVNVNHIVNVR